MKVLNVDEARASLDRRYQPLDEVADTVAAVLKAVRERGDAALLEYAERFDRVRFAGPERFAVNAKELEAARAGADQAVREAIRLSRENVEAFTERSKRQDWSGLNAQGAEVGEVFHPFERVGIYVPGGTAPLVSTVNMTVAIARAVGCPEIVVCTPPQADGSVNPSMLFALAEAGATEIYKLGGAQAIAAMAYGTATIKPVLKVFGPGNAYVMEAKRQVFGAVAVDLLPGPSEVMVLADGSGNPRWIAADLLAQAEHGGDSVAVLVSDSAALLETVQQEIAEQAKSLTRQGPLHQVLEENCVLVKVGSMEEGVDLANDFAPEHLSFISQREAELLPRVRGAGAIFLGNYSPVAAGDFVAGPSHELPTGGAGKSFAGLTADQFQRRTSWVRLNRESLAKTAPVIDAFAAIEGLDAHGRSGRIRLEGN